MKYYFPVFLFLILINCRNAPDLKEIKPQNPGEIKTAEKVAPKLDADSVEAENSKKVVQDDTIINKLVVSEQDSAMDITMSKYTDHRIFGYEKPNAGSRKLILISIFTADVEGNPVRLPFGSFYDTSRLKDTTIKFIGFENSFVKAELIKSGKKISNVFFEKKWVEFQKDRKNN